MNEFFERLRKNFHFFHSSIPWVISRRLPLQKHLNIHSPVGQRREKCGESSILDFQTFWGLSYWHQAIETYKSDDMLSGGGKDLSTQEVVADTETTSPTSCSQMQKTNVSKLKIGITSQEKEINIEGGATGQETIMSCMTKGVYFTTNQSLSDSKVCTRSSPCHLIDRLVLVSYVCQF